MCVSSLWLSTVYSLWCVINYSAQLSFSDPNWPKLIRKNKTQSYNFVVVWNYGSVGSFQVSQLLRDLNANTIFFSDSGNKRVSSACMFSADISHPWPHKKAVWENADIWSTNVMFHVMSHTKQNKIKLLDATTYSPHSM